MLYSGHNANFTDDCNLSNKSKDLRSTSTDSQVHTKPEISMDKLTDLFENKCKISSSTSGKCFQLSFRDPGKSKLAIPVVPREKYPGITLQDGNVHFVLRASPLTPVLQRNQTIAAEGKSFKTACPINHPQTKTQSIKVISIPFAENRATLKSDAIVEEPSWDSHIALKPTRRRLHPDLSNEMAARKTPPPDTDDYIGLMNTTNVETFISGQETKDQPKRIRLGKVNLHGH